MLYYRKLKTDTSVTGLLPAIIALAVFIFIMLFFGPVIAFKVLAGIVFIFSLFQYLAFSKVKSLSYFLSATYMLSFSILLVLMPVGTHGPSPGEFSNSAKFFAFTTVLLLIILIYRLVTRKVKWKGREVLELAAAPVELKTNGYTDRPRPVGRIAYSKDDLLAFAHFLRTHHIALPYVEEDRIVLVPVVMGKEYRLLYSLSDNYKDYSWIAFSYNGAVMVQISKRDYMEFRDQLSFDQLCESMGELFKEFFELFLKNEGDRIIGRLDSLGINPFS